MAGKSRLEKKQNVVLHYAVNLIGMGAGIYIGATELVKYLATLLVKSFHQSATLVNPVSVPSGVMVLINLILAVTGLLCAALFILNFAGAQLKPALNFSMPKNSRLWAFLPVFIGIGFIINGLTDGLRRLLEAHTSYVASAQTTLPTGFFATIFAMLYMCVIPAILEEILCRGIMQGMLRRWGVWFSIVVSSVLFMLLHGDIAQMPGIFAFSVMLGLAYYATGSLTACITLHFANNIVVFIFLMVQQKLSGAAMVGFSFYIMLLVCLCAALCVGYIVKTRLTKTLRPIPRVCDPKNRQKRTTTLATSPFYMVAMIALTIRAFYPLFMKG